jgi:hypothetical protein
MLGPEINAKLESLLRSSASKDTMSVFASLLHLTFSETTAVILPLLSIST